GERPAQQPRGAARRGDGAAGRAGRRGGAGRRPAPPAGRPGAGRAPGHRGLAGGAAVHLGRAGRTPAQSFRGGGGVSGEGGRTAKVSAWLRERRVLLVAFLLMLPLVTPKIRGADEIQYFSYLRSGLFDRDFDFTDEYRHFYDQDPQGL